MKIAVLLSGGVDSSVALNLLHEEGHELTAYYLKIWLEEELAFLGDCPWQEDLDYARAVCDKLGVPLRIMNMQQEYLDTVVEYTIKELKAGRTPSPDIMCNKMIKFGKFIHKLDEPYDKIASGHYADIREIDGKYRLFRSPDPVKDQTYFLTYLNQEQLSKILFPIGKYTKDEVRRLAARYELPTAARKDSQGICFLGKIKYSDFIKFHLGEQPGDIINIETGEKLGEHKGFWFHTIGQRQGLGLGGGPWYVAKKDSDSNIIYVSHNNETETITRDSLYAVDFNWIQRPEDTKGLKVKLRHGPHMYDCSVDIVSSSKVFIRLSGEDQGISPGQFAIL
ncbi:MAG: tRNA 2-thiouridine(34) synthase MnmA, partial [Candidatus Kapaibacterium sp.]